MILEMSVAVIALAFVILVGYLVVLIKSIRQTLKEVDSTLMESKQTMEQTKLLGADLNKKMEALDPLFHSVENLGDIIEYKTALYKARQHLAECEEEEGKVKASDFIAIADVGIRLWNKINKRRDS